MDANVFARVPLTRQLKFLEADAIKPATVVESYDDYEGAATDAFAKQSGDTPGFGGCGVCEGNRER
jgi:hypothetical protein